MSNSIIIECIKSSSKINGKTRWTTEIGGDGVVLNAGDIIEVEGCAINSKGIGGDVLEIPSQPIKGVFHNKAFLDFAYYVVNNGTNALPLPQYYMTTTGAEAWSGITSPIPQAPTYGEPRGKWDIRYGMLQDPDNYSFYNDPLQGGGAGTANQTHIAGASTSTPTQNIAQSGGNRVVAGGATNITTARNSTGDPWTPLHRYGNDSSASMPSDALGINAINCDRSVQYHKKGSAGITVGSVEGGGADVDGQRYHIIWQGIGYKGEQTFNQVPWSFYTHRTKVETKSGFKNPSAIASEITEHLHAPYLAGEAKWTPTYMNNPEPKEWWSPRAGSDPPDDFEYKIPDIEGSLGYSLDAVIGVYPPEGMGTVVGGGNSINMVNFNGPSYATFPANPYNLRTEDEGGGGFSCRLIGAKHPYRIIAGTNITCCPRKIGHGNSPYILESVLPTAIGTIDLTFAGNEIIYSGDIIRAVNSLAGLLVRVPHDNFNTLCIESNTLTDGNGNTTIKFHNKYYTAHKQNVWKTAIQQLGFVLTSNINDCVHNLAEIPANPPAGHIVITNIPFTQTEEELVVNGNIHHGSFADRLPKYFTQGRKYGGLGLATTEDAIMADTNSWFNELDCGRGKSSKCDWTLDANHLPCPWTTTQYEKQTTAHIFSKYTKELYDGATLTEAQIAQGFYIERAKQVDSSITAYWASKDIIDTTGMTAEQYCLEHDVMIVCIRQKTPSASDYYKNGVIGVIIKEKQSNVFVVPQHNYIGFNPSYTYPQNECVALINNSLVEGADDTYLDMANGAGSDEQRARYEYFVHYNKWGQVGAGGTQASPTKSTTNNDAVKMSYPANYWTNFINLGAPEVYLDWDNVNNRFAFHKLHKETETTNATATADTPVPSAGAPIVAFNASYRGAIPHGYGDVEYTLPAIVSQQSGISIIGLGGYKAETVGTLNGAGEYELTQDNFYGSFWERLGFSFRDLVALQGVGQPTNPYTPHIQGHYTNIASQNAQTYPLSTNALYTTPLQASMAIGGGIGKDLGMPMYNLNYYRGYASSPSAEGATLMASSLPKKLTYPYWLLYSNIIGGLDFYSGNNKSNCLGIITRNYTAGDFAYAFNMGRQFIIQQPAVLTSITQEILNPDFTPADIDDYSVVLYKITKRSGLVDNSQDAPYEQDALPQKRKK